MTVEQEAAFKLAAQVVRDHFFSPDSTVQTRELALTLTVGIGTFLNAVARIETAKS